MSKECRYYDFDRTEVKSVIAVDANYSYDIHKAMEIYVSQIGCHTLEELKNDMYLYPKEITEEQAFVRYIMAIYNSPVINVVSIKDAVDVFNSLTNIAITKEKE